MELTELGRIYHGFCAAMVEQAESAAEAVERLHTTPRGTLHIASPPTLTQIRLAPVFARFLVRYPEVRLRVEVTSRTIDPQAEGFDAILRVRMPPLANSALLMRSLGPASRPLVASPILLERMGCPDRPSDFTGLPAIMMASPLQPMQWQVRRSDLGPEAPVSTVPLDLVRLFADDAWTCRNAALQGVGFALLPEEACAADLATGALVHALPPWEGIPGLVHALYPPRLATSPALRCFLDFLGTELGAAPSLHIPATPL
jgi:DNA-binding transcriptional LysR family regulator